METLKLGPLDVTFHRTVRVSGEGTSNLPPSLGHFELYKVSDYRETCPETWEDDAYFIAMHDVEALWMSFDGYRSRNRAPVALLVGCGGINALNGEKLGTKLEKDNYLVTPPQPWLDGWKDKDGTVYQFVTTTFKSGEGLTVGEQIMGSECKSGGIGIAVFEAKDPDKLVAQQKPQEGWGESAGGPIKYSLCDFGGAEAAYLCAASPSGQSVKGVRTRGAVAQEMGVGKGGKIHQKIYPDPHGLETWREEPTVAVAVYLVNAEQFSQITGKPMPPLPRNFKDYAGKWYGLKDESLGDVQGTDKFTGLKTVFAGDTSNVEAVKGGKDG